MTGRTHDLAAFTTLSAFISFGPLIHMSLATSVVTFAASMIGAVTPDIDQPTAGLWRKIPAGSIFGHIIGPLLGHHRMISHSLVGVFLAGWGMRLLLTYMNTFLLVDMRIVWWAFMFGFLSHLIMDTITKDGVPWLFPFSVRIGIPPVKKLRITTGSLGESLLVFPGLLLLNGYFIYLHYSKFIFFFTRYISK